MQGIPQLRPGQEQIPGFLAVVVWLNLKQDELLYEIYGGACAVSDEELYLLYISSVISVYEKARDTHISCRFVWIPTASSLVSVWHACAFKIVSEQENPDLNKSV